VSGCRQVGLDSVCGETAPHRDRRAFAAWLSLESETPSLAAPVRTLSHRQPPRPAPDVSDLLPSGLSHPETFTRLGWQRFSFFFVIGDVAPSPNPGAGLHASPGPRQRASPHGLLFRSRWPRRFAPFPTDGKESAFARKRTQQPCILVVNRLSIWSH
jgi:hypothetical protein